MPRFIFTFERGEYSTFAKDADALAKAHERMMVETDSTESDEGVVSKTLGVLKNAEVIYGAQE